MQANLPQNLTAHSAKQSYNSYYLLNPNNPLALQITLKLLGDRAEETLLLKGKPEDFASNPNAVFLKVDEPITLNKKNEDAQDESNTDSNSNADQNPIT